MTKGFDRDVGEKPAEQGDQVKIQGIMKMNRKG